MPVDVSKFFKGFSDGARGQMAAAIRAVDVFGEHVIGDAQQLTPVKTGALKASGTTEESVVSGEKVTKKVGFNTNYAAAVHERLDANHAVGQAKFLAAAIERNAPKLGPFVAGEVKKAGGHS